MLKHIKDVALLLEHQDVSQDTVDLLKRDPRVSVQRLVHKWELRFEKVNREFARVRALYEHERNFYEQGCKFVAGVDEAGRGPLAGPVVVAAVILPVAYHISYLNDSKKLSAAQRDEIYRIIKCEAVAVYHSVIDVEQIDKVNIYQATKIGMYTAINGLLPKPQAVLIDAVPLSDLPMPALSIIGGDGVSASIAAASIVAKVERDRIMEELHRQYPEYGFNRHKGYATQDHLNALRRYGPCPVHRKSFAPVKNNDSPEMSLF
ncbi:MAG TPA: ribonuclease HII [Methylomusa anaerophila]|nr:ribonuclease HII [Methylomusa anaerophila]HML86958.1 ribonuclease HII [Methylomusa anaerophila]